MSWIQNRMAASLRASGMRKNRIGLETPEESVERVLQVATRYLRERLCTFVTAGDDGATARIVMPLPPGDDLTIHVATTPTSVKARQVAASGQAVLLYNRGMGGAVTAYCQAEIIDNRDELRNLWAPIFAAFWPDGPEDENYIVIRCHPVRFEVYAANDGIAPEPFGQVPARIKLEQGQWQMAESF